MIISGAFPLIKRFLGLVSLGPLAQRHVLRLLGGFLNHRGRMSSQQAAGSISAWACHRASVGRFLGKQGQRLRWVRCGLAREFLRQVAGPGRYVLVVDTTCVSQQGSKTENTYSTGNRQRRPAQAKRYHQQKHARRSCHGFVMGLLLAPTGERIPFYRSYQTHEYCQRQGLPHRTQADLAAEIVREVSLPAQAQLVVVGDTAFEAQQVRQACAERGFSWILPANTERVLAGAKPRPKLTSLIGQLQWDQFVPVRLVPGQGPFAAQQRAASSRIGPKTKTCTFSAHQERRCLHSVGEVQVVFSTKQKPENGPLERDPLKLLLTNDLQLSLEDIVRLYALRWQIELFFKELKSTLGLHQYRFRQFQKVEAWVNACLIAVLYLEWLRYRQGGHKPRSPAQGQVWRSARCHVLAALARQAAIEAELVQLHRYTRSQYGIRKLRRLLRAALPKEQRDAA